MFLVIKLILTTDIPLNRVIADHIKQRNNNTKMDSRLFVLFIGKLQVLATSHWYEVPNTKLVFKESHKSVHRTGTVLFAVASHTL